MPFRNREDAARHLAGRLTPYRGRRPLVLGIPRGGVPMARIIADALDGDLDVMLVHKLRAPGQPELAIGSVDEAGRVYLAPVDAAVPVDQSVVDVEARAQLATLQARRARYTAVRPPLDATGRLVIIVDDGIATGSTMVAAIRSARASRADRIVVATAVSPPATVRRLKREADEVVCLETPLAFAAVGAFFEDFSEVSDDDVVRELSRPAPPAPVRPRG